MKVLFDTNICIDIIADRKGLSDSSNAAFEHAITKRYKKYITTTTVTDIMYILRKAFDNAEDQRKSVREFVCMQSLARVNRRDVDFAFSGVMSDFEDAVQASCAKRYHIDFIVTRNVKDFKNAPVKAVTPEEFLKI